jgi:hypothetical protein
MTVDNDQIRELAAHCWRAANGNPPIAVLMLCMCTDLGLLEAHEAIDEVAVQ